MQFVVLPKDTQELKCCRHMRVHVAGYPSLLNSESILELFQLARIGTPEFKSSSPAVEFK